MRLMACLHEAIVAAIGRATGCTSVYTMRSSRRSPRRSPRVNTVLLSMTAGLAFSHALHVTHAKLYESRLTGSNSAQKQLCFDSSLTN